MTTKQDLKQQLYKHCVNYVTQHIEIISHTISQAQSAVIGETKNTAGDRYETERAMKQRETELYGKRLQTALLHKQILHAVNPTKTYSTVETGALVSTSIGEFFIAISTDEITIDDTEYCIISVESPLFLAMAHKKVGDVVLFREKEINILDVC